MARGSKCHRRSTACPPDNSPAQPPHLAKAKANAKAPAARATFKEANIIRAVMTLYDDELRPYSRILKKRLAEHAGIKEVDMKNIDAEQLRVQCSGSAHINVTSEEGGEWSALLVGRAPEFVDIYSECDVYSDETWAAAEVYFRGLGDGHDISLPGGRYATAFALAARHLPFLSGFTLGRICHFTQIAITQRKLLGYANGKIVPFFCSQEVVKAQFAEQQLPHVASGISKDAADVRALPIADWNAARAKLQDILATAINQGSESVPLSNVKRLFRSTYQLELSETALGHCRLTDLLQNEQFRDICKVQLQDRGYVVLPAQEPPMEAGVTAHPILDDMPFKRQTLDKVPGSISCTPQTSSAHNTFMPAVDSKQRFCIDEPLCLEDIENPITNEASPVTVPFPFPTPSPQYFHANSMRGETRTWDSVCRSLGMSASWTQSDSGRETLGTEEPHILRAQLFCPDEPLDMQAVNQEEPSAWMSPAPCVAWTPSPHYSTRCFLSYWRGCADKTDASAMSQSRSRSTSAESRFPVVSSNSGSSISSSSNDGDHEALRFVPGTCHVGFAEELACNNEGRLSSAASNQELCEAAYKAECQVQQRASCNTLGADDDSMMLELPRQVPPPPLSVPVLDGIWQQRPASPALPEQFMAEGTAHAATPRGTTTLSISSLVSAVSLGSGAHAKGTCNPCTRFQSSKNGDHEALRFATGTCQLHSHYGGFAEELACNNDGCLSSGAFNQELYEATYEAECQVHQQAGCKTLAADFDMMTMHKLPGQVPPPPLSAPVLDGIWQQRPMSLALPERFMAEGMAHAATPRGTTTLSISLVGAVSLGSEAHAKGTCNPCAHFHSSKGCRSAELCLFCHSCPPGELKRRQKAKKCFECLAR